MATAWSPSGTARRVIRRLWKHRNQNGTENRHDAEEEEEADRMLETGDFSSVEAMLKTFGCTPEQIEQLMSATDVSESILWRRRRQNHVTRTPKASVSGAIGVDTGTTRPSQTGPFGSSAKVGVLGVAQGRCFRGDACRYSHDPSIIPKI